MLSRTQPRPAEHPQATLADLQLPIVEAYHESLPPGAAPRIMASRTAFVADSRAEALRHAEIGLGRRTLPFELPGSDLDSRITAYDVHLGTPQDVIESLSADPTLQWATDLVFQVHSVDPPHPLVLRSIELLATEVAPAFGRRPITESSKK
jgi:alkanesulfonate monooxygenase SsuD/methylene tetrahydromethanopterin reductase-like flavin-dependent oxidoreductase (luciferase family)